MNSPGSHRPEGVWLGIVVMVATALTMAFGDALVKRISADFSVWQIYVLRSLFAIPLTVVLMLPGYGPAGIMPKFIGWAFLRSLLLVGMWIAFYAALPVLSLSVVAAVYYTGPLFITLLSALLTREPVGVRRWVAIFAGFLGVLIILRPGTEAFSWLTLLPVLSALFYATAAIVTRTKCADENPLALSLSLNICFLFVGATATASIVFWGAPAQASAFPFLLGPWTAMGTRQWELIALMAGLIVATSAGVAMAYQSGPSSIIATFDYSYLPFAVFWSFVFFSDMPDLATIFGMLLIAAAGLLTIDKPEIGSKARAAKQAA